MNFGLRERLCVVVVCVYCILRCFVGMMMVICLIVW